MEFQAEKPIRNKTDKNIEHEIKYKVEHNVLKEPKELKDDCIFRYHAINSLKWDQSSSLLYK